MLGVGKIGTNFTGVIKKSVVAGAKRVLPTAEKGIQKPPAAVEKVIKNVQDPFAKLMEEQVKAAQEAARAAKKAAGDGVHLEIGDKFSKEMCAFPDGYGLLCKVPPTKHVKTTCYSEFSRYLDQVEILKKKMLAKKNGALRVLNIGVARGQEPLTHINTAFNLSKNSGKTISNLLDLTTVDVQLYAPKLPPEASMLDSSVISYLEHVYKPQSGKSFWGTPIEEVAGKLLQTGKKQDVILFNNVIQHMAPKNEEALEITFKQLADLIAPKGLLCAALEKWDSVRTPITMRRVELLQKILKENGFEQIKEGIFQKVG